MDRRTEAVDSAPMRPRPATWPTRVVTTYAAAPGPTAIAERALGPDLARGVMLLAIALANSHYFLQGSSVLGGYPQDGSAVDRGVTWLLATFVDGRAFPMFGLLFGYGVARIAARQAGPAKATRRLLWRRAAVLIAVGFVDALLFYVGDILAVYGVLLLLGAWVVRWKDRWLLVIAAALFLLTSLPNRDSMSIATDPPDPSMLPVDLVTQLQDRLEVWPFIALLGPIGFATPFLVGLWAGRRRILEQPERHRVLLLVVAVVGIGAAVLGAQPVALMLAGVADPSADALSYFGPLHDSSGVLGGFGYAALVALLSVRVAGTPGRVARALSATGQRSLTCYLAQSVVWQLAFTPYLLDLSGTLTVAGTALLAVATWLGTVLLAVLLARAGRRGPFEVLVRRVTYGHF